MWPVYVDSLRTRKEGRKISKENAIATPNLRELKSAAMKIGLEYEVEAGKAHPAIPWKKTGRILVGKSASKKTGLIAIARELASLRRQTRSQG